MMMSHNSFPSLSAADSRYTMNSTSQLRSIESKFSLSADVNTWDLDEIDDELHTEKPGSESTKIYRDGRILSLRGLANLGCLVGLCIVLVAFFAGYPMIVYFTSSEFTHRGGYNAGGMVNGTGQIPSIGNFGLIDDETPHDLYTITSPVDGSELALIFSDEFNQAGRTFYPGDDPYWEAVDLHYWATNNLEWYDPSAITTVDGSLEITLSQKQTHGLNYQGGMMSTWNKFCFTGGYISASVQLPGVSNIVGLWPAIWYAPTLEESYHH